MKKAALLCIVAVVFGVASPFVAGVIASVDSGLLYAWFHLLPTAVDHWLWPEGDVLMLALATVVFTLQYIALFALGAATLPLVRLAVDFVSPPRHRNGLVGRRT